MLARNRVRQPRPDKSLRHRGRAHTIPGVAHRKKPARKRTPTLKAIGADPSGSALLLARTSTANAPTFRLAIDEGLVDALESAQASRAAAARAEAQLELPPAIPARVESKLGVKEIQNLLRQGRSVEAIAKRAGVDPEWVQRWEVPIVWERVGMAAKARRVHLRRARGGISRVPLGEAVTANLKRRGVKVDADGSDEGWDSTRKPRSSRWVVTFSFHARGREQVARWEYDPESDTLSNGDKLGNELGWIPPIRRRSRA